MTITHHTLLTVEVDLPADVALRHSPGLLVDPFLNLLSPVDLRSAVKANFDAGDVADVGVGNDVDPAPDHLARQVGTVGGFKFDPENPRRVKHFILRNLFSLRDGLAN